MWLIGDQGTVNGVPFLINSGKFILGRSRESHVRISDTSVSRQHARLEVQGSDVTVFDLESRNGILINQQRTSSGKLMPGDVLTVGAVPIMLSASPLSEIPAFDSTIAIEKNDSSFKSSLEQLTPRQHEVLQQLLRGHEEKAIAADIGCQPRTVHNHIQDIYRAFNVHSRQQLLVKFIRLSF